MSKIKFSLEDMQLMNIFSFITKTTAKHFIKDDNMFIFIVDTGQLRRAVGSQGANVKKLEQKSNRKIKIVEFSPNVLKFIRNFIYPIKIQDIKETDVEGIIEITPADIKSRGIIIGRNGSNLKKLEEHIKLFFDIKEIKVKKG